MTANPATVARLDTTHADPYRTLIDNNAFGNKNRWTDSAGTQLFDGTGGSINLYGIDHLTGLGYFLMHTSQSPLSIAAEAWNTLLTTINGTTAGTFSDWRAWNYNECASVIDHAIANRKALNFYPFNLNQSIHASVATILWNFGQTIFLQWQSGLKNSGGGITTVSTTIMVRNHYT